MNQTILDFLCNYLSSINIPYHLTKDFNSSMADFDSGLRNTILKNNSIETTSSLESFDSHSLYHFTDFYHCNYSFFQITEEQLFFIGPYLLKDVHEGDIRQLMTISKIPETLFSQLLDYYNQLTLIQDKTVFFNLLRQAFRNISSIPSPDVKTFDLKTLESREAYLKKHQFVIPEDPVLSMNILEKRYQGEDALLDAITQGNAAVALSIVDSIGNIRFSEISGNKLRDYQNRMISFNTLLRRTAYTAGVHPFYIDVISCNYARLIENVTTAEEMNDIMPYMIRSYCDLVKKRSMALYSEPVRQILVTIDASISGDLSLKRFANELFLNTSYLSSLFKKETGMTLTDYVNENRINTAKRLLKSTTLSIQAIASAVGIPDIHYFTRLFRRETGLSPREYRKK